MLLLAALYQAVAPVTPASQQSAAAALAAEGCNGEKKTNDEIVVCGQRASEEPYRIGPQAGTPSALPQAEFSLSNGVRVKIGGERGAVGPIPTNRAAVTLKIRF